MDLDLWLILGTALLLGLNRAMTLGPRWHTRRVVFWTVQVANLALACGLIAWGIPGLRAQRAVDYLLAGLLVLHIVQNNRAYVEARRAARTDSDFEARRQAVLDKLQQHGPPDA